jgi:hypothetical protein
MKTSDPTLRRKYDNHGVLHWANGDRAMCSNVYGKYTACQGVHAADGEVTTCVWCVLIEMGSMPFRKTS